MKELGATLKRVGNIVSGYLDAPGDIRTHVQSFKKYVPFQISRPSRHRHYSTLELIRKDWDGHEAKGLGRRVFTASFIEGEIRDLNGKISRAIHELDVGLIERVWPEADVITHIARLHSRYRQPRAKSYTCARRRSTRPGRAVSDRPRHQPQCNCRGKCARRCSTQTSDRLRTRCVFATVIRFPSVHHLSSALIKELEPVHAAIWDSDRRGCLSKTRVGLLRGIRAWIDAGQASERIYWLNGLAGTGKSTVAASVCEHLVGPQQLCLSFFISRRAADQHNARKVIHTIAYQLADVGSSDTRKVICRALQDLRLLEKPLQEQVSALIIEPLRHTSSLVLVVVDALDEIEGVPGRKDTDLLSVLANGVCSLDHVKLFVTSRNEDSLRKAFGNIKNRNTAQVVQLHDMERSIVQDDIRVYLSHSFEDIKKRRGISVAGWPSSDHYEQLLHRAGALFVYAVMVINFVDEKADDPVVRLDLVLATKADSAGPAFELLDNLYLQVLVSVVETEYPVGGGISSRLRAVLGALVLLLEPLHSDAIAALTGQTTTQASSLIGCLAAVVLGAPDGPISLFHQSFRDFITSAERCHDVRFLLPQPSVQHRDLALHCLRMMKHEETGLRYTCELTDVSVDINDAADLKQRQLRVSEAMRYAVVFWAAHVHKIDEVDEVLGSELRTFFQSHLTHWFDLLVLLRQFPEGADHFEEVLWWCRVSEPINMVHNFLMF
jgi:hypothetical protein